MFTFLALSPLITRFVERIPSPALAGLVLLTCVAGDGYARIRQAETPSPARTAPAEFRFLPGGGDYETEIRILLAAETAGLVALSATPDALDTWSRRLTDALRREKFAIAQVLVTEDDWQKARQGQPLTFTVLPGVIDTLNAGQQNPGERGPPAGPDNPGPVWRRAGAGGTALCTADRQT